MTDINGNFTLNLSTPNAKIEISFIGYKTQVLAAQSGKLMAVKLVDDTELLDEVVVVGYGSQKKVNMTVLLLLLILKHWLLGRFPIYLRACKV